MTTVTIRLPDNVLHKIDSNARRLSLSRSEYIKQAVLYLNKTVQEKTQKERLINASLIVRQESMTVNHEFESIENDPQN
jgi:metal-responsive CopG/Arc/MetJ family transcriptional regulator